MTCTDTSQLVFVDGPDSIDWHDIQSDFADLKAPETEDEILFVERFGEGLWLAKQHMDAHIRSGRRASYQQACDELQIVYRKLCSHLDAWRRPGHQLDLRLVAPKLLEIRDSRLMMPGESPMPTRGGVR